MKILDNYTGSAMLNNALQTIEAMACLNHVNEITTELLADKLREKNLSQLYTRLKNYTMLFSKNGPLHNDKKNGVRIYEALMTRLINGFETNGTSQCEISGLFFEKPFDRIYSDVLEELSIPTKGKDTTINRVWWPLIGGLGSDAQALPQAKFTVNIHPICIALIQFLPLSALLYKGKIVLVDSINFDFTRAFIKKSYEELEKKIELSNRKSVIENIKLTKGDYLTRALEIFDEMRFDYEDSSDLNLWCFTNSGTGASCEIERIPTQLFQKLFSLYFYPQTKSELKQILNSKGSNAFLEKLENNEDSYILYPLKKYKGVSIAFFEKYHTLIENNTRLTLASYVAGLLKKYLPEKQKSFFAKTDSYSKPDYAKELYSVLLTAAENGNWDLLLHCEILDEPDSVPIKNSFYKILKMIHFYYLKNEFREKLDELPNKNNNAINICAFFIDLIENDTNKNKLTKELTDKQNYQKTTIKNMVVRASERVDFLALYNTLYKNGRLNNWGLYDLLRLYFLSKKMITLPPGKLPEPPKIEFLGKYESFAIRYMDYYLNKYKSPEDQLPFGKFKQHVLKQFPKNSTQFYYWLNEGMGNLLEDNTVDENIEELFADELGNANIVFTRFAIKFYLTKYFNRINRMS